MSKKKKSIIHSRFYQVYFGVVLLIVLAMCAGRVWLNGVLVDYEAAQPVYVAEEVAALFENADYERIYTLDTSAAQIAGGDRDFYLESMQAITNGRDIGWSEAFSADQDEQRYNVTLDGEKFATFTLVPSGQTTGHGNRLWKLGSITTNVQIEEAPEETPAPTATPAPTGLTCFIRVPTGYAVTVDGVALSEANASVTTTGVVPDGFLPSSVTPLTYTRYTYTAQGDAPVVAAKDANGVEQELTLANGNSWSCDMPGDETFQKNYSDAAMSLAKRIALITVRDASVDSIKRYCANNSPARKIFDNYSNRWATPHSKTAFRNVEVSQFYVHSDKCFTCHVKFDFVLKTSSGNQTYPTEYTFCVVQQGGGKLYNLMMQ